MKETHRIYFVFFISISFKCAYFSWKKWHLHLWQLHHARDQSQQLQGFYLSIPKNRLFSPFFSCAHQNLVIFVCCPSPVTSNEKLLQFLPPYQISPTIKSAIISPNQIFSSGRSSSRPITFNEIQTQGDITCNKMNNNLSIPFPFSSLWRKLNMIYRSSFYHSLH